MPRFVLRPPTATDVLIKIVEGPSGVVHLDCALADRPADVRTVLTLRPNGTVCLWKMDKDFAFRAGFLTDSEGRIKVEEGRWQDGAPPLR